MVFILRGHFSYALIREDKEHCGLGKDSLCLRVEKSEDLTGILKAVVVFMENVIYSQR